MARPILREPPVTRAIRPASFTLVSPLSIGKNGSSVGSGGRGRAPRTPRRLRGEAYTRRPLTTYSWANSVTMMAGRSAITAVALIRFHSMPNSWTNWAIVTVSMGVRLPVRIRAKRNSFQVQSQVRIARAAIPGTARGFTFMNTPGYDPVSVTGLVAGGCNLVLFTTGRGSVFGFKPAPSIKISSNSALYEQMSDDMDVNAGRVLDGVPMEQVAAELLGRVVTVASGQPSKSEAQGVGEAEFCPWTLGGTL